MTEAKGNSRKPLMAPSSSAGDSSSSPAAQHENAAPASCCPSDSVANSGGGSPTAGQENSDSLGAPSGSAAGVQILNSNSSGAHDENTHLLNAPSGSAGNTSSRTVHHEIKLSEDARFMRELMRRASGNKEQVAQWLQDMGEEVSAELLNSNPSNIDPSPERNEEDIEAAARDLGAPQTFFCPVSFYLFRDPVLIPTGQTYERYAIEQWLSGKGSNRCPITGEELQLPITLTPNIALRKSIEDWAEEKAPWMLTENGKIKPIPAHELQPSTRRRAAQAQDITLAVRSPELDGHRQTRTAGTTVIRQIEREDHQLRFDHHSQEMNRLKWCGNLLWVITAAQVAMFIAAFRLNDWKFEKLDVNPLIGFSARSYSKLGGTSHPQIVEEHEWWRIATSVFINAGLIHLEATMGVLWTFGRFLASKMSIWALGLLYLVSGIGGVLVSASITPGLVTAGASGAAFGFIGAVLSDFIANWGSYNFKLVNFAILASVGAINAVIGLTPFIDSWCAVGGLICGMLSGAAIILANKHGNGGRLGEACILLLQIVFSILVIAIFVAAIVGLLADVDVSEHCPWCKDVGCLETKWWNCDSAAILPDFCVFNVVNVEGHSNTKIICPSGDTAEVNLSQPTQDNLEMFCRSICDIRKDVPLPLEMLDET